MIKRKLDVESLKVWDCIITEQIKLYNVISIKKYYIRFIGHVKERENVEDYIEKAHIEPCIHLVISRKKYIMERLLNIDVIEIIHMGYAKMKITVKWIE